MQPVQLGWIDYGSRDRSKILSVLNLLSAPEAVDELGIGVVRDAFSDLLFPGTSTVQTRAKYFFLVPYLLRELEKEKFMDARKLLSRLAEEELKLIPILKKSDTDDRGVIGGRSGEKLQRKPSSIYWNGLFTFGILNSGTRLSLEGYAKTAIRRLAEVKVHSLSGHSNNENVDTDDMDAHRSGIGSLWRVPPVQADWRNKLSIELSTEEAEFLREKIIQSPRSKNSLFAYLLFSNAYRIKNYEHFSDILMDKSLSLPSDILSDVKMAERFSDFTYGANIRYNVILANGENEHANALWDTWYRRVMEEKSIEHYNPREPFNRLSIRGRNFGRIFPFLSRWKEVLLAGDTDDIDNLIKKREIDLKGKDRAKLFNNERLSLSENWVGSGRLQYRFPVGQRFIADIEKGLGLTNV